MKRYLIAFLAVYFLLCVTAVSVAHTGGKMVREASAENLAHANTLRADAEARAQQYRLDYNALLSDYIDLRAENERLAARLNDARSEIELLKQPDGAADKPAWRDAGEFQIYHYCPCAQCCGKSDGITATGALAEVGRTIAVDPEVIPLGSEVKINGQIYIAEDVGVHGKSIDVFVGNHAQAQQMGTYPTAVSWR